MKVPVVGLAYASAFGVVGSFMAARPAAVRDGWVAYLSTNRANLTDHPVRALVGSAFVTDDGTVVSWVVLAFVDVGPSYVIAPALVLGLLLAPSLVGRAASGLGFALLAPHLFGGLARLEVSSVAHVVAISLALLAGLALAAGRRTTRALSSSAP